MEVDLFDENGCLDTLTLIRLGTLMGLTPFGDSSDDEEMNMEEVSKGGDLCGMLG